MAQIKIKWRNKYTFCNSLQAYHTNKNLLASITSLELSQECTDHNCWTQFRHDYGLNNQKISEA